MALLVLGLCWSAYMINGDPLPGNDQQANMLMSVNLLKHASLSIDPRQAPENFIREPLAVIGGQQPHRRPPSR